MCQVLRCDAPVVGDLRLSPKGDDYPLMRAGLCIEHQEAVRLGERWRLDPESNAILMGRDIDAAGAYLAVGFDGFSRDIGTVAAGGETMLRAEFTGDDGAPLRVMLDRELLRKVVQYAEGHL